MGVRGKVDKAKLHMLWGRLGEGRSKERGCGELGWCGFGKGCVHGLHMCSIKGKGLGVVGFGCLGMVLGRGWRAGRRIGVERWGVERGLGWIRVLDTVGSVLVL